MNILHECCASSNILERISYLIKQISLDKYNEDSVLPAGNPTINIRY